MAGQVSAGIISSYNYNIKKQRFNLRCYICFYRLYNNNNEYNIYPSVTPRTYQHASTRSHDAPKSHRHILYLGHPKAAREFYANAYITYPSYSPQLPNASRRFLGFAPQYAAR